LAVLLENAQTQSRIAASFSEQNERVEAQRRYFGRLVQGSVKITSVLKGQAGFNMLAEHVLSNVFHLLPLQELLLSARALLEHGANEVGTVLLQSITEQCRHVKATDQPGKQSLLDFAAVVTSVIEKSTNTSLKRAAIACIDQISERFGKQDTSKILSAAETISGHQALGDTDTNVRIMALLCLASMVEVLRDDFIGFVPRVFPQTFDYLHSSIQSESQNATLHNACFALINAAIEYLPFVFTGNLLDRSLQLAQESANSSIADAVQDSRAQLYELLTKKQSASEIFAALDRNLAIDRGDSEYLDFAKSLIEHHSKSTIVRNSAPLFELLLRGFDYRRQTVAT
jgi:U3 small nucleolar RNA-associated protein 10